MLLRPLPEDMRDVQGARKQKGTSTLREYLPVNPSDKVSAAIREGVRSAPKRWIGGLAETPNEQTFNRQPIQISRTRKVTQLILAALILITHLLQHGLRRPAECSSNVPRLNTLRSQSFCLCSQAFRPLE